MDRAWLEMRDVVRSRHSRAVWLPLYASRTFSEGEYGYVGQSDDYFGVRTLAVYKDHHEKVSSISFSDLGRTHGPTAWRGEYTETGVFVEGGVQVGVELVLIQDFDGPERSVMHLSQDLVFALGLIREGDTWLRPEEGYAEVAKIERDASGKEVVLAIRPEFLRDYLSARAMGLLTSTFRERQLTVEDPTSLGFNGDDHEVVRSEVEDGTLEVRSTPIHEGGFQFGESAAVFKMGRTDEWEDDELPVLGDPTDANVVSEQKTFKAQGRKIFFLAGEFRRSEWIEPADVSRRVARDRVASNISFITDASGERILADKLNNEDIGRWLWFSPKVIVDLLGRRGTRLRWYTQNTAGISSASGSPVHFGLNMSDLVVVYAYDIARLDEWEQRIWAGFNVAPEGGLGDELHAAQVRAEPARTQAPEEWLPRALLRLSDAFQSRWQQQLFIEHSGVKCIINRCHRFRSDSEASLLALAKDLSRVSSENFNSTVLHQISPPPKDGRGAGSLKSMERVLATVVAVNEARSLMTTLVGLNDLRQGDAHLPSSSLAQAMILAGIDTDEAWLRKGAHLIHNVVAALYQIAEAITDTEH